MSVQRSVATCGYVLTDQGRTDLVESEHCDCPKRQVDGGLLVCRDCGTIWASLRQALTPNSRPRGQQDRRAGS